MRRYLTPTVTSLIKIAIVALMAHGLLLFNDGLYFDAWLFDTHIKNGDYGLIYQWQRDHGRPLAGVYYIINGLIFTSIFSHKALMFVLLLTTAWAIYGICRRVNLPDPFAVLISLVGLTFPAYQTYPDQSSNAQIVNQAQFYLAAWLVLSSSHWSRFKRHLALSASLILFLISFSTEAYLAFYVPFLLIWLIYLIYNRQFSLFQAFGRLIRYRLIFIVLPALYYLIVNLFFAPQGLYANYTDPALEYLISPTLWAKFLRNAVVYPIAWGFESLIQELGLLSLLILGGIFIVFYKYWSQINPPPTDPVPPHFYGLLLLGCLMFVIGSAPYVAGNRIPTLHGYESRYSLMMSVPIGVLISAAYVYLAHRLPRQNWLWTGAICLLLSAFVTAQISNYITWQAEWVKTRSWMTNLKTIPLASDISIFKLDDQWEPLPDERNWQYFYRERTLEFSVMLQQTLNNDQFPLGMTGNPLETELSGIYRKIFFVDRYDRAGCQATLTIQRAPKIANMTELALTRQYFYYRLLAPESLNTFLRSLSEVNVALIRSSAATNCKLSP